MNKLSVSELNDRLIRLERVNLRWKRLAGITGVTLALVLMIGGVLIPRPSVAQRIDQKAEPRMEYMRSEEFLPNNGFNETMNKMAKDGWEVFQIVPTQWGERGLSHAVAVARRPLK